MDYKEIIFEKSERIGTITLNRPERLNAFTLTMNAELLDALMQVENDPDLRVAILTGAGRAFCAGADLSARGDTFDRGRNPQKAPEGRPSSHLKFFFSLKKPIIAAVNGPAVGVGVTTILPLDIRIASESARLGIVFNRRGVLPERGCPWLLPRIIGISKAAEMMYTGRIYSAREALEFGLVSRVTPDDELIPTARALAKDIAANCAPISVALTKHMLYRFLTELDVEKAEQINNEYFAWAGKQADAREGVVSFLEKRKPDWKLKVPGDMPDFFPLNE